MTMTVKLDPVLEQQLRLHSAAVGRPASEIIRQALTAWLAAVPQPAMSAHALGSDLFGRHSGPADLAGNRKQAFANILDARQAARRAPDA